MFLDKVPESDSLEMVNLVLKMRTEGKPVISLAPGDPSFDTPREIIEVANRSMLNGGTHYVHSYGTTDVREAAVRKVGRKNGIRASLENAIFITAKTGVFAAFVSVATRGYEALVPDPGYFYSEPIILSGGRPVRYSLSEDLRLDIDEIKRKTTPKTRAIMINTPSNPTGRVLGRSELKELYDFCSSRGIYVLSDEAYEDLVYTKEHTSIGSFEKGGPELVLSLYTMSKSYSMPGFRAGYVVGPSDRVARMNKLLEHTVTCYPPFIMHASAYALDKGDRFIERFRAAYVKRRALLKERMSEIPAMDDAEVEGSFYAFPGYKSRLKSRELSLKLLEEQNVAVLPGTAFGPGGEKHLRLSFASNEETIEKAMDGMKAFFAKHG